MQTSNVFQLSPIDALKQQLLRLTAASLDTKEQHIRIYGQRDSTILQLLINSFPKHKDTITQYLEAAHASALAHAKNDTHTRIAQNKVLVSVLGVAECPTEDDYAHVITPSTVTNEQLRAVKAGLNRVRPIAARALAHNKRSIRQTKDLYIAVHGWLFYDCATLAQDRTKTTEWVTIDGKTVVRDGKPLGRASLDRLRQLARLELGEVESTLDPNAQLSELLQLTDATLEHTAKLDTESKQAAEQLLSRLLHRFNMRVQRDGGS
jgi:hypothetical protein